VVGGGRIWGVVASEKKEGDVERGWEGEVGGGDGG